MAEMKYYELIKNPGMVALTDIPILDYHDFREQTIAIMKKESCHCVNYFIRQNTDHVDFYIIIANDSSHKVFVYSHRQKAEIKSLESITQECFQLHIFEREIYESIGLKAAGSPDMRRLKLHDEVWPEGNYPLRKDFDQGKLKDGLKTDYVFKKIV